MSATNLYQVLGIYRSDPKSYKSVQPFEIKQGYHAALLENHPDKMREATISIPVIKSAYSVLSDPLKRGEYDRKLATGFGGLSVPRATGVVDLADLKCSEEDPDNFTWTRECRCGDDGGYILRESDLEANGTATSIVVQCIGCSLWIEVQYDIEE